MSDGPGDPLEEGEPCTNGVEDKPHKDVEYKIPVEVAPPLYPPGMEAGKLAERHGHAIQLSHFKAVIFWLGVLFLHFVTAHIAYKHGLIDISQRFADVFQRGFLEGGLVLFLDNLTRLIFMGLMLGLITGIYYPHRFDYIFSCNPRHPRLGIFLIVFLLTTVFDKIVSLVIKDTTRFNVGANGHLGYLCGILFLFSVVLLWHLKMAYVEQTWGGFLTYCISRTLVFSFYISQAIIGSMYGYDICFRRCIVGWLFASLAEFNHPVSLMTFAVGAGMFAQGCAYGDPPPIIPKYKLECQGVQSPFPLTADKYKFLIKYCLVNGTMTPGNIPNTGTAVTES